MRGHNNPSGIDLTLTFDHYVQVDLLFCIILRTARRPDIPFSKQRMHKKSNSDTIILSTFLHSENCVYSFFPNSVLILT